MNNYAIQLFFYLFAGFKEDETQTEVMFYRSFTFRRIIKIAEFHHITCLKFSFRFLLIEFVIR